LTAPPKPERRAPRPRKAIQRTPLKRGTKRPARVRKTPRSKLRKLADKLWSLIVRSAGKCRLCGKTEGLQGAHGFSRRYLGTRWDLRNGWALCAGCHISMTHRPLEWDDFLRSELGELYEPMRQQAIARAVPDYDAIIAKLQGGAL
jgi:5-methylcytosine-specific restriction endonuclease McrA